MLDSATAEPQVLRKRRQNRQRTKSWQVSMTPEEYGIVWERKAASGLSVSSYGRAVLLGTQGPRARQSRPVHAEFLAKAVAQLNMIGSNLNQIARTLNAGRAVGSKEALMALADTREAVLRILDISAGGDRV